MKDFDDIFEEYFQRIYNKVLGMVKNPQDAEDITQDVFISVYKNLKKFKKNSQLYTWIYRIALNKTYDFFRKNKKTFELNEEVLSVEEVLATSTETKMLLEEKLEKIDQKEKELVILKDIYGYKFKEIAKLKNENISTIKSAYYKAIKKMGGN